MNEVKTADIYECCYYLLNGCEILSIEGRPVNGKITCEVIFNGPDINDLQLKYFHNEAVVNLFAFRRAYCQINSFIQSAKRRLKSEHASVNNGGTP